MTDMEQLLAVAKMYYEQGLTQQEIAEKVFLSRSHVSRMLKEARALGDDGGDGGFAGAGGAVEDHVGGGPALDEPPQQGAGAQQVLLSRHLIQGLGPYFVCQWPHGGSLLSCGPGRKAPAGEILRYYTTLRRLLHPRFAFFPGVWYNRGRGDLL